MVPHNSSGLPESLEGSLANYIGTSLGQRSVRVGQKRTVLVGEKKPGAIALTRIEGVNFVATSFAKESSEVRDSGLGCGIAEYTGHRAECRHRREVDYRALTGLYHRAQENLGGKHRACPVEIEHSLEGLDLYDRRNCRSEL